MIGNETDLKINFDMFSTSNKTIEVKALVLRENEKLRMLYIPKIVDKGNGWNNSIEGSVVVQRKMKTEKWSHIKEINLTNLKAGEWVKMNLSSSELLLINEYSNKLREMCIKEGMLWKIANKQILILDEDVNKEDIKKIISALKESPNRNNIIIELLNDKNLIDLLFQNKEQLKETLSNISEDNKKEILEEINLELINPKRLKEKIDKKDEESKKESFWQEEFESNPHILSVAIPNILQIISDQTYMGGKRIDNRGSSIADFVYKKGIDNVCIIEIKTPLTKIIEKNKYRDNVYVPSQELTSSIVQVKEQKDSLMKNYNAIWRESHEEGINFKAFDPKCYLIIGNTSDLDTKQLESFNLFRNELRTVEIITYDELLSKMEILYKVLGGKDD